MSADILDTPEAGSAAVRGGIVRSAGLVVGVLLSLLATPILTRHLGAVDYGRFVTVTALVTIAGGFTDAGLTNLATREHATLDPAGARRMLRHVLGLRLLLTLGGIAAATLFAVAVGYPAVMVAGTVIAGAGYLMSVLQSTLSVPLSTSLRVTWITALELLKQSVTVAVTVALALVGAMLLPFFTALLAGGLVSSVATAWVAGRASPRTPDFDRAEWSALVRDALPYAVATALGIAYFRVTMLVVGLVSSGVETGYYAVAFRIVEVGAGLPWVAVFTAFPILARAAATDQQRLRYALQRMYEVALLAGTGCAIAIALGAEVAIDVIAGAGFEPAVTVLRIQALALIPSFLVATWGFALLSLRRHGVLLVSNAVGFVAAVVLTLPLAAAAGAEGAAVALTLTELILAASYALALMRPRPDLRVSQGVLWRVAIAAALAALLLVPAGLPELLRVALGASVYVAAAVVLGAVPDELLEIVRRRRR